MSSGNIDSCARGHIPAETGRTSTGRCRLCHNARSARWRDANRERFREIQRAYAERNREARADYQRDNRERFTQWMREWRARNPEAGALAEGRRRAHRRDGSVDPSYAAVLRRDPCAYCGGPGGTLDHVEPIARGGAHDASNLVGACGRCNTSKSDRPLLEALLRWAR